MYLKEKEWNDSYKKGGNILFYPHEEIIRFLAKYIKKRVGIDDYEIIRDFHSAIDIGCGIGRHVNYLNDMGFEVYGIDLSEAAINYGKKWFDSIGKSDQKEHLIVASVLEMPFEDGHFDIAVSHGVFDSMNYEIAVGGIRETARILKSKALMYIDLIMPEDDRAAFEEVVTGELEHGTIQSYYTTTRIHELLDEFFDILRINVITTSDESNTVTGRRAHIICERK